MINIIWFTVKIPCKSLNRCKKYTQKLKWHDPLGTLMKLLLKYMQKRKKEKRKKYSCDGPQLIKQNNSLFKTGPLPLLFQNWPINILVWICLIKLNLKIKQTGFLYIVMQKLTTIPIPNISYHAKKSFNRKSFVRFFQNFKTVETSLNSFFANSSANT